MIVITGCAHSGIVEIAEQAQKILNKKIALLLGGFHLMYKDEAESNRVGDQLRKMEIDALCPTHCTGERAMDKFRMIFTHKCIADGVGKISDFN